MLQRLNSPCAPSLAPETQLFRPLPGDEDTWFLLDQSRLGATVVTCEALTTYLAERPAGIASERGHTWVHQGIGGLLDDFTARLPVCGQAEALLLPGWALAAYRAMRDGERQSAQTREG